MRYKARVVAFVFMEERYLIVSMSNCPTFHKQTNEALKIWKLKK